MLPAIWTETLEFWDDRLVSRFPLPPDIGAAEFEWHSGVMGFACIQWFLGQYYDTGLDINVYNPIPDSEVWGGYCSVDQDCPPSLVCVGGVCKEPDGCAVALYDCRCQFPAPETPPPYDETGFLPDNILCGIEEKDGRVRALAVVGDYVVQVRLEGAEKADFPYVKGVMEDFIYGNFNTQPPTLAVVSMTEVSPKNFQFTGRVDSLGNADQITVWFEYEYELDGITPVTYETAAQAISQVGEFDSVSKVFLNPAISNSILCRLCCASVCSNEKTLALSGGAGCIEGETQCIGGLIHECQNGEWVNIGSGCECNIDQDCEEGYICENGFCIPEHTSCNTNDDCPDGYECKDGQCVPIEKSRKKILIGAGFTLATLGLGYFFIRHRGSNR